MSGERVRPPRTSEQRTPLRELMDPTRPPSSVDVMLRFPYWTGEGPVVDDGGSVGVVWEAVLHLFEALLLPTAPCTRCGTLVGSSLVSGCELALTPSATPSPVVVPDGLWEAVRHSKFEDEEQVLASGDLGRDLYVMAWHLPSVCERRRLRDRAAAHGGD